MIINTADKQHPSGPWTMRAWQELLAPPVHGKGASVTLILSACKNGVPSYSMFSNLL